MAWGSYLNLQLIAGCVALICFAAALGSNRRGWYLAVTFFGSFTPIGVVAAIVALLTVSRQLCWVRSVSAGVLFCAGAALDLVLIPETDPDPMPLVLLLFVATGIILTGTHLGIRRKHQENFQRLEVAGARAEERVRISRDIHDSLSHRLSLIAIYSGALEYREDLSDAELRRTAGTIREQAEGANEELHEVLTVLRDDDPEAVPTTSVTAVIEAARRGGVDVTAGPEFLADPELMAGLSILGRHAVHRTIQESLRNARQHAPGESVSISSESKDEVLRVWVSNPVSKTRESFNDTRSSGYGLVGLKERAESAGGRLWVDRTGGFRVGIEVPWTATK